MCGAIVPFRTGGHLPLDGGGWEVGWGSVPDAVHPPFTRPKPYPARLRGGHARDRWTSTQSSSSFCMCSPPWPGSGGGAVMLLQAVLAMRQGDDESLMRVTGSLGSLAMLWFLLGLGPDAVVRPRRRAAR